MINPNQYFYCKNGEVLKSLKDLRAEIKKNCSSVNLENFYHHVTPDRNDYFNWVKYVFGEAELADSLNDCKTPFEFLDVLNAFFDKRGDKHKNKQVSKKKGESEISEVKEDNESLKKEKGSKRKKIRSYLKTLFRKKSSDKESSSEQEINEDSDKVVDDSANKTDTPISDDSSEVSQEDQEDDEFAKQKISEQEESEESSKRSFSDRSEALLEKVRSLRKKSYLDLDKQKETVSDLTDRYEELYSLISVHRKSGHDMFIPQMKLRLVKPKIHFLEVSDTPEERAKVRGLLDEVLEEIEEALKIEEPDLKKEILEKARVDKDITKEVKE